MLVSILKSQPKFSPCCRKLGESLKKFPVIDPATIFAMLFGSELFEGYIGQLAMASMALLYNLHTSLMPKKIQEKMRKEREDKLSERAKTASESDPLAKNARQKLNGNGRDHDDDTSRSSTSPKSNEASHSTYGPQVVRNHKAPNVEEFNTWR